MATQKSPKRALDADTTAEALPVAKKARTQQTTVTIAELERRIRRALHIAEGGGLTDGAHHKQNAIDQIVRALLPNKAAYEKWVAEVEQDGEYLWDIGISS